jgi:hypothetical protein
MEHDVVADDLYKISESVNELSGLEIQPNRELKKNLEAEMAKPAWVM